MKKLAPDQVGALLRPGMRVAVLGGCNEPRGVAAALHAQPEATAGVEFTVTRIPGISSPTLAPWAGSTVRSFFVTPEMRAGFEAGSVRFVPMQYRHVWDDLVAAPFDLAIAQFTPPDGNGDCSLGIGAGFLPALLERSEIPFVAEWNRGLPRLPGAPTVPEDRFDYVVETEVEPPTLASRSGPVAERIGVLVANLVQDGDCIETGVGAIPGAVLAALHGHRDLGFHSGLLSDGVKDLVEAGAVTGVRKTIDTGRLVAAMVLGSPALYDWASRCDLIDLRTVDYTHDVRVIAQAGQLRRAELGGRSGPLRPGQLGDGPRPADQRHRRRRRLHARRPDVGRRTFDRRPGGDRGRRPLLPHRPGPSARTRRHGAAHRRRLLRHRTRCRRGPRARPP